MKFEPVVAAVWVGQEFIDPYIGDRPKRRGFIGTERGGIAKRLPSVHKANRPGIDHWPVDPAWLVTARIEPAPGRTVDVPDVFGSTDAVPSLGDLAFEVDGVTHRLQALSGGDDGTLWLIFGDATNGHETYGGGRYLYTDAPDSAGAVTVDFNRAYNPPCVFTPYATCSLPWPANRLPIRVEAGERRFDTR